MISLEQSSLSLTNGIRSLHYAGGCFAGELSLQHPAESRNLSIGKFVCYSLCTFTSGYIIYIIIYIFFRVKQAHQEGTSVVDVDGSYLYRKYKALVESGEQVVLASVPAVHITGWVSVTEVNYQNVAPSMPSVTSGMLDY